MTMTASSLRWESIRLERTRQQRHKPFDQHSLHALHVAGGLAVRNQPDARCPQIRLPMFARAASVRALSAILAVLGLCQAAPLSLQVEHSGGSAGSLSDARRLEKLVYKWAVPAKPFNCQRCRFAWKLEGSIVHRKQL
ncbi:hypothetical protein HK096_005354 [Nowakowskiella sp. JEL0078]|nr:hypothetical protein HK096_005354 [Nowakowskiella sp. JEL0078]